MTSSIAATAANPYVSLLLGQQLGDYRLDQFLGSGGFGVVFKGTNIADGRKYAVKVLTDANSSSVIEFRNEALLLRQLNSCAGVINIIDGGNHAVHLFTGGGIPVPLNLDYHVISLANRSLDSLLLDPAERSSLSWVERLRLWRMIVKSLRQMHAHSVVHRDLKSGNCLLVVEKGATNVRLGDLGRSRDLAQPPSRPAQDYFYGRGDLRYAAPEALTMQAGASVQDFLAADYYGLGSLLVEIITGQPMTALAISDIQVVMDQAIQDFSLGLRRDLRSFQPSFRTVISGVVADLPQSVRQDASHILNYLCHPEPAERLGPPPLGRFRADDRLEWVLKRADIMIKRLEIDARELRRRERAAS